MSDPDPQSLPQPAPRSREISASFDLRIGSRVSLRGQARITPFGVISGGIAVTLMTLGLAAIVAAKRR